MQYKDLTPEQLAEINKAAAIAKAANEVAAAAQLNDLEICDIIQVVTALAKRKLTELKKPAPRLIKTTLPEGITTLEQAKTYLTELYNNGELYNPDDSAADCLKGIHEQDAHHMDFLMNECCKIFRGNDLDIHLFLLNLDGHVIED